MSEKDDHSFGFTENPQKFKKNDHFFFKILSPSETIFVKFKQKVSAIFKASSKIDHSLAERKLTGRIHELQSLADVTLIDLLELKKYLSNYLDPVLLSFIFSILDPLIKEIGKSFLMEHIKTKDPAEQVKFLNRYVDLIEKSKEWINIKKKTTKENLEQAVIYQAAKELVLRIDRDIAIIQDYATHTIDTYAFTEPEKRELKEILWKVLSVKLAELNDLKKLPNSFSKKEFMEWRMHKDHLREHLFSDLLHMIDTVCQEEFPQKTNEESKIKSEANDLEAFERKVRKAQEELAANFKGSALEKKAWIRILDELEKEAFSLNTISSPSFEGRNKLEELLDIIYLLREENNLDS